MLWGAQINCRQGLIIEELTDKYNLICLNDGSPTYLSDIYSTW